MKRHGISRELSSLKGFKGSLVYQHHQELTIISVCGALEVQRTTANVEALDAFFRLLSRYGSSDHKICEVPPGLEYYALIEEYEVVSPVNTNFSVHYARKEKTADVGMAIPVGTVQRLLNSVRRLLTSLLHEPLMKSSPLFSTFLLEHESYQLSPPSTLKQKLPSVKEEELLVVIVRKPYASIWTSFREDLVEVAASRVVQDLEHKLLGKISFKVVVSRKDKTAYVVPSEVADALELVLKGAVKEKLWRRVFVTNVMKPLADEVEEKALKLANKYLGQRGVGELKQVSVCYASSVEDEGSSVRGEYDFRRKKALLYRGADLETLSHILVHHIQACTSENFEQEFLAEKTRYPWSVRPLEVEALEKQSLVNRELKETDPSLYSDLEDKLKLLWRSYERSSVEVPLTNAVYRRECLIQPMLLLRDGEVRIYDLKAGLYAKIGVEDPIVMRSLEGAILLSEPSSTRILKDKITFVVHYEQPEVEGIPLRIYAP